MMRTNGDCSEFDRKEYKGIVDLDNITEEGMYTIETGLVPAMDYHAFQDYDDNQNIGYLIKDSITEDINGFDLMSELGLEGKLIIKDDEDKLYAKDAKTGETIEIASPFYRAEKTIEDKGVRLYRTTIVREFTPIDDELRESDFNNFRNVVFGGYRDNPFSSGHQIEHNDDDNNKEY